MWHNFPCVLYKLYTHELLVKQHKIAPRVFGFRVLYSYTWENVFIFKISKF
jgi:hypothetical protein